MPEQPEVSFREAFAAAGGDYGREAVPYPITVDYVRRQCELRERILRLQFDDGQFNPADEAILETLPIEHPDRAWERWDYLKGLWFVWQRGYQKDTGRAVSSWMLQYREPVRIVIAGRTIDITSRSRAAMVRLARHEATRTLLGERLDAIEVRIALCRRWKTRRALAALADRVEGEWEHHTRGILANALSDSGRAALPEEAPTWWDEVSADDEARILVALIEAGPVRFDQATKRRTPKPDAKTREEIEGFGALLRMWESKLRVPPMELEDQDLARTLHALDIGHPGTAAADAEDAFAA